MDAERWEKVAGLASQPQGLVSWWQAEVDATDALGVKGPTSAPAAPPEGAVHHHYHAAGP